MSISIFFSYSHKDEALRDRVAEALSGLKRNQIIQEWHDRQIPPGSEWKDEIDRNLNTADIILLLVSASFLASEYCWSQELNRAMARHEASEARVIPIILRPCDWADAPFAKLQMLPKDAKAVTLWTNEDAALTDVAQGIRAAVNQVAEQKKKHHPRQIPEERVLTSRYQQLEEYLSQEKWKEADDETYRLMITTVGKKTGQWFEREDLLNFPCEELRTIDGLWVKYSQGRFGFSVQKEIYLNCGGVPDGKYHEKAWKKFCHMNGRKTEVMGE
jgi:hypothetical protein